MLFVTKKAEKDKRLEFSGREPSPLFQVAVVVLVVFGTVALVNWTMRFVDGIAAKQKQGDS